jgi:hypothetical protein
MEMGTSYKRIRHICACTSYTDLALRGLTWLTGQNSALSLLLSTMRERSDKRSRGIYYIFFEQGLDLDILLLQER